MTTALYYNASTYGNGLEGVVNYANSLVDWWMVPFFAVFVFLAITISMSNKENRQFPMAAIIAFSLFVTFIAVIIFKLMTTVSEYLIYAIVIFLALAIAWGIWQTK